MGYESLSIEHSFTLMDLSFGTTFALPISQYQAEKKTMELIFAICVTGLGLFTGMFFIWKGQH
jgi:hypothetical protein